MKTEYSKQTPIC